VPSITLEYLLLFAGFVLPGAISMYVYSLKVPQKEAGLKERVLEAICFSLLNFIALLWLVQFLFLDNFIAQRRFLTWLIVVACFVILPAIWPLVVVRLLRWAEKERWIGLQARTAWDDFFFTLEKGCWLQVTLTNGAVVGGRFDRESFASAYPDPGHLYLEELWEIDAEGSFVKPLNGNPGILLRPSDYKFVKVFVKE
jgi:hypothetical protein